MMDYSAELHAIMGFLAIIAGSVEETRINRRLPSRLSLCLFGLGALWLCIGMIEGLIRFLD